MMHPSSCADLREYTLQELDNISTFNSLSDPDNNTESAPHLFLELWVETQMIEQVETMNKYISSETDKDNTKIPKS